MKFTVYTVQWARLRLRLGYLDLGGVVEVLWPFALEEAEPVEDVGEEGEKEEAGHDGEDQDPEGDSPSLGRDNSQHLHQDTRLLYPEGVGTTAKI